MAFGFSLGGGKSKNKSKNRVWVPDGEDDNSVNVLDPVSNAAGTYDTGLTTLEGMTAGDQVANMNRDQLRAIQMIRDRVNNPNGPFQTATETFMGAAEGENIRDLIPILAELDKFGVDVSQFMDPNAWAAVQKTIGGDQFGLEDLTGAGIPESVVDRLTNGEQVSDEYLRDVVGGNYLFGGDAFNAAVQAANNQAMPEIISRFSRGAGGGTGGLVQAAVGQSAVDAFARQYAQERALQQGAADQLGSRDMQRAIALGDITQADLRRRGDVSGMLTSNRDRAATTLFDAQNAERNRDMEAILSEAGLTDEERMRQLMAAEQLPALANQDVNLLTQAGDRLQAQEQAEIDVPWQRQLELLQAALGGFPIEALLGSNTKGKGSKAQFGFSTSDS